MNGHELSANAMRVLEARYLLRDAERRLIETPDQLFERVARAVAQAEGKNSSCWTQRYHALLTGGEFLPNSPTLMNAGTALGQLSACFVLPIEDTMESIFGALKQMALVQRTGGGTGFSFSRLRPRGDLVASTCGEASGPVSFMRIFDCATEHIKQGGKRRGANMGVLGVEHPDIMEFIGAKLEARALANFNLSVSVTDAFMRLADVPGVPDDLKRLFVTALEIPAERHLAIQAAFQRHVDNSVSKTINLRHDATPADVAHAYRRAWALGLKGITVYRYGAKPAQVLELGVGDEPQHYDHASRCDPEECRL